MRNMKKHCTALVLFWVIVLPLLFSACKSTIIPHQKLEQEEEITIKALQGQPEETTPAPEQEIPPNNFKIALCGAFESNDPEYYYSAQKARDMYSTDKFSFFFGNSYDLAASGSVSPTIIRVAAKPNPFAARGLEEIIASYLNIIKDPDIKAIITSSYRALAIFKEVRKARPDILLIAVQTRYYESKSNSKYADIIMDQYWKELEQAWNRLIPQQAQNMGAKTLVYYTVERHMHVDFIRESLVMMEEVCKETGMEFIYADVIDPVVEGGLQKAQQFIEEDIPRKIAEYGKDTAFFSTIGYLQNWLIKYTMEQQAIVVSLEDYNIWLGHCAALGIEVPDDRKYDQQWLNGQIHEHLAKTKNDDYTSYGEKTRETQTPIGTGRFTTWPVPIATLVYTAAVEYAMAYIEGQIGLELDKELLQECLQKAMQIHGYGNYNAYMTNYEDIDNYFLISEDFLIY